MSGSFATASLNVGAAAGPILGGLAFGTTAVATGPLIVSVLLVCATALVAALFRRSFLAVG